ncbi:phenylalanine--tRNA ligase subunit beta [Propionimicrobium sp. PCR01-08-3]|uniref:phenylalanine--tRNA ligase subunit beta n=1 Tax=Propionimicrobium sp. PCR01-08-3 TaxID=3052086 RepID=UPI00255CD4C3|nr:phenylalanine--tRNA ligase subunit beta [Propionimicrobium sp. PCR01-08-3]WIY81504.1 phenylalanine--tRNA ligase subunit beta [Propionimicrobium sp. PCR01-08-3]
MRVPLSWLRELVTVPAEISTQQIADALTRAGLQVERIEATGADVSGPVVVGRVLEFVDEPQKNGKIIRWCQVDVGEAEPRGIVCGAHNFEPGDNVVVSLPGAVLPGGFEISARKTYGHKSDGMICAVDELGIGEDHTGILVLPAEIDGKPLTLGADAMDLLQARDEVFEIDVTPDSAHCLSMRGMARETAQALELDFTDPYPPADSAETAGGYPIKLESPNCTLFAALSVTGVDPNAPVPLWMSHRLAAAGMRSISLAVDITNYVMLESGQPLHAYDADQLAGPIVVRQAREGEHLVTLDDVDRTLSSDDLLITDDSGPIGLAGVMGGQTTELNEATSNIVLEAAHFAPGPIGRTFRRHHLPSEASARFARGVDPALPLAAARQAAKLMVELGGGTLVADYTLTGAVVPMPVQQIDAGLPGKILGASITAEQVIKVLRASEIQVTEPAAGLLELVPPTWRPDLVDPYDYVEEVGRKLGLDLITAVVPTGRAGHGLSFEQRSRRSVLSAVANAGFAELITLPFISTAELDKLGLVADDQRRAVVRLANPLADTQPFMRTTLLPGLFAAVARNTSRSQDDLALFECGSVFWNNGTPAAPVPDVSHRPTDDEIAAVTGNLPDQPRMLAAVLTGNWVPAGWQHPAVKADWTHAVYFAETAAAALGLTLTRKAATHTPWHPGRCAELSASSTDGSTVVVGYAGELHPSVVKAFGLPERACAVELNLDAMIAAAPRGGEIAELSAYPLTKQDVALIVDADMPAEHVQQALVDGAGELLEAIRLFDIYTGAQAGEGKKSLAFALGFRAPDRTLTEAEAAVAREAAVAKAAEICGAVQRA